MSTTTPFDGRPDPELGRLLREHLDGPAPAAFLERIRGVVAGLPPERDEWDVLARWTRPGVVAAAMAAGFLLGVSLWRGWVGGAAPETPPPRTAPIAMLEAQSPPNEARFLYTVLEGR